MSTHLVVGPEGVGKASGSATFVDDIRVENEWLGGCVRSPVARGQLLGFEYADGFDFNRVVIVRAEDIPGRNVIDLFSDDQPILASGAIEYLGEPLLLIAAPDLKVLNDAIASIRPNIRELPPVLDPGKSQKVFQTIHICKGMPTERFEHADVIVKGEYRTGAQEHAYLETQGILVFPKAVGRTLVVHGSMQCPYYVQKSVATALGVPCTDVRVVQAFTGGGFGGKEDFPSLLACYAALLAAAADRPIRMVLGRSEDIAFTPKRHPSVINIKTAVNGDGTLSALDVDVLLDGGAYETLSPGVLSRACLHAAGPYRCEHVVIHGRTVATNYPPSGAFRGFGAPQVCFAIERQMDRIAATLGINPLVLRRLNTLRHGDATPTGQTLDCGGAARVLEKLSAISGFAAYEWGMNKTGKLRQGKGISLFFHGSGFTGTAEGEIEAKVSIQARQDRSFLVRTSATDFGQGTNEMLRAVAARALGVPSSRISVATRDTADVPDSGPTVASRTCMIVGRVLFDACSELLRKARDLGGLEEDAVYAHEVLAQAFYSGGSSADWDDERFTGSPYSAYAWGADLAEVTVDVETFQVKVSRIVSVIDIGDVINPRIVRGQVEGGSMQGIGFALYENPRREAGRVMFDSFSKYLVPTTLESPEFETVIEGAAAVPSPLHTKGVGELPMNGAAPAVIAAVEDALGVQINSLPAVPEVLFELWREAHPEKPSAI